MSFLSCLEKQETDVCEHLKTSWRAKLTAAENGVLCRAAVLHMWPHQTLPAV